MKQLATFIELIMGSNTDKTSILTLLCKLYGIHIVISKTNVYLFVYDGANNCQSNTSWLEPELGSIALNCVDN